MGDVGNKLKGFLDYDYYVKESCDYRGWLVRV